MPRTFDELAQIVSFADALPAAIWVGRAPTGECVYVNREFERILGITPPTDASRGNYVGPYGVHLRDGRRYPEDQMPFERVMRARALVVVDDLVIHRHDGERTFLRVFAQPIFDDAGQIAWVIEAFIDITREVEAEEARREGERQLQMVQRLESIGSLAGGIAHDFNNLLSIVKLVAVQLAKTEKNASNLELITHLSEVSDSAAKLTRSLLGIARRERSTVERVNLNQLVAGIGELARRTLEKRLSVRTELSPIPVAVEGNGGQFDQLVMNLLMNARDAIPGEGTITLRTARQTVKEGGHPLLKAGDYAVIEVEDTGTGVDPAVRDRLFEPYVTTKVMGAKKGTGLGLSTVFAMAQAHGGHAEIGATSANGTTMRVWLPASALPAAPDPFAARGDATVVRGEGTVLVVDDEPLVLKTAALTLRSLGYSVFTADGGAAAVEVLRRNPAIVTAVVLDMTMPGLSTTETFHRLRALRADLPVVVMTGTAINEQVQQLLELGVAGVLAKPFDDGQLSRALATALGR